jgi:hypothetical protein
MKFARLAFLLSTIAIGAATAAPFTPGNLVVYRVGTGGPILSANGNPVFLDEFTPGGAFVQTLPLPTSGAGLQKALIASGTATSDGLLTRSADGTCLAVPGYGRNIPIGTGTGNLTSGTIDGTTPVPRVVGRVTAGGAIDVSTSLSDAGTATNFRGAASNDCTAFWVSANAGGVRYAKLGDLSSVNVASGLNTERGVAIFSGQLYTASPSAAVDGVAAIGTGMPTLAAQPLTKLTGTSAATSAYSFFLADLDSSVPGNDTLYIADDGIGLMKFSLVAGAWISNGVVGAGSDAYRGLTATVRGNTVTLYATRKGGSTSSGGGELVRLVDSSGYNGALIGNIDLLVTAASNTALRGVALAPGVVTMTPSAGANGTIDPATPQVVPGGVSRTFTVTPAPGYTVGVDGTCGGTLVGTTFTTSLATANCTVIATFARVRHTVTPSAGPNGTIDPASPQSVPEGGTTTFNVVAAPGYSTSVDGSCGGSLSGTTFTTNPIAADCTVSASFTLITFPVTSSAGANGSIDPSGTQVVPQGTTATFSVIPVHGFAASVGGSCGGTLNGTTYTTAPVNAACSVDASFTPLPRYTVSASSGAHGSVSPASQAAIAGDAASISIAPDAGYNYAVRGTCGGSLQGDTYVTRPASADCTVTVTFARKLVLFVGNSYTFGRVDPVMSYNAASVADLTYQMWLDNPVGANDDEPHPWGGIPGVFKKLVDQAGLDWDVSISARNAASLRGQYLNSNPAGWDLRGNVASQRFDIVMLQDLSDEPLPPGRGANANLAYFNGYVDKLEQWVHDGAAQTYTETQLFGGTSAACQAATGASASACNTARVIAPANTNARAGAEVYLYETWARPDMIGPNGTNASGQFYSAAEGLEAMTADFHSAYFGRAAANGHIEDVAPVGDAFLRAVQSGVAMRDPYVPEAGKVNLWHTDFFHPSKYGSYLSALVHFATLTGYNPLMLGGSEQAAADLGIAPGVAAQLQKIAQATVSPDVTAPVSTASVSPAANTNGWNSADVTVTLSAVDEARGSGLDFISYALTGAQSGGGHLDSGGSVAVSTEGVTTLTWFAQDRAGNAEAARTLRISIDKTKPSITGLPGAECSLWPANRRMVQVATISASGGASDLVSFNVAASSSEATAPGDADVAIAGSGDSRTVALRADRDAAGPGRVYTITVSATDAAGNSASASATCRVPHDLGK